VSFLYAFKRVDGDGVVVIIIMTNTWEGTRPSPTVVELRVVIENVELHLFYEKILLISSIPAPCSIEDAFIFVHAFNSFLLIS